MRANEVITPDLEQLIATHCSDIVATYRAAHAVLYRGIELTPSVPYIIGESPIKRKPKNLNIAAAKVIDSQLLKAGFVATRSNSIFCSSWRSLTQQYGTLMVIFPYNGFDFTYSTLFSDLYLNMNTSNVQTLKQLTPDDFVKSYGFTNQNLVNALKDCREVYVHGKYIAVNVQYSKITPPGQMHLVWEFPENYTIFKNLLGFDITQNI